MFCLADGHTASHPLCCMNLHFHIYTLWPFSLLYQQAFGYPQTHCTVTFQEFWFLFPIGLEVLFFRIYRGALLVMMRGIPPSCFPLQMHKLEPLLRACYLLGPKKSMFPDLT